MVLDFMSKILTLKFPLFQTKSPQARWQVHENMSLVLENYIFVTRCQIIIWNVNTKQGDFLAARWTPPHTHTHLGIKCEFWPNLGIKMWISWPKKWPTKFHLKFSNTDPPPLIQETFIPKKNIFPVASLNSWSDWLTEQPNEKVGEEAVQYSTLMPFKRWICSLLFTPCLSGIDSPHNVISSRLAQ